MKTGLKWAAGIMFLIGGLGTLTLGAGAVISCVLLVIAGLLCIPPVMALIETKLEISRPIKYILVIGLWIVGGVNLPKDASTEASIPETNVAEVKTSSGESNVNTNSDENIDTVSEETKPKERLLREIKSLDKPFNSETYSGDVTSLQMELVLFGSWAKIIEEGKNNSDVENKKLAGQLEKKVQALQIREFPKLRKKYGAVAAEKLWENDVDVKVEGGNNATITFINGMFSLNKNKADAQRAVEDILKQFRFKRSQYKWYKYDDEYTYYKMDTPSDGEPVTFEE